MQIISNPPFMPRNQVSISGVPIRKPTPIARYVPPRYRSWKPVISGPQSPSMGQNFSWGGLVTSIPYGIGGVVLMYLGGALPQPMSSISTVAGIGLIGLGLYNVFSGEPEVEEGGKFTSPSAEAFPLIDGTLLEPKRNAEVSLGLFSEDYEVEILWGNANDEEVSFTWDIVVREEPFGVFGGAAEVKSGSVHSAVMRLDATKQDLVKLNLNLLTGSDRVKWFGSVTVQLQVRKYNSDGVPTVVAESSFIVVS